MGKDVAALPSRAMLPVAGALPDRLTQGQIRMPSDGPINRARRVPRAVERTGRLERRTVPGDGGLQLAWHVDAVDQRERVGRR